MRSFVIGALLFISALLFASVIAVTAGSEPRAQAPLRPQILGIAHVAFLTSDMARARRFYGQVLGLDEAFPAFDPATRSTGSSFKINDRQYVEIYPGLPAGQDERLLHIAFETSDAEALRRYLAAKGVSVPADVERSKDGNIYFRLEDADRHAIEFVEHGARSRETGSRGAHLSARRISDRLLHAGLTVADAASSDRLYKDILGFSETWRGGARENVLSWINMKVPDGTDYIEYMLVSGPVNRERLGTLHHIALQVPDIQQALERVRERVSADERRTLQSPRVGRNNRWQLNLYDPDGSRVELMEPYTMR